VPELTRCAALLLLALICVRLSAQTPAASTALVGATIVDGNGGPRIADAVVILIARIVPWPWSWSSGFGVLCR
jgi:hypothetical protein